MIYIFVSSLAEFSEGCKVEGATTSSIASEFISLLLWPPMAYDRNVKQEHTIHNEEHTQSPPNIFLY